MKRITWIAARRGWVALASITCAAEPPATAVRVELSGGPNPGVYQASSATSACTRDLMGKGSWAVQLNDWTGSERGLRSLQLVVPAAAANRGSEFYLGLVFGDVFSGPVHEIETRVGAPRVKGEGWVEVREREGVGTVVITGVTGENVTVSATIQCRRLDQSDTNARRGGRRAFR